MKPIGLKSIVTFLITIPFTSSADYLEHKSNKGGVALLQAKKSNAEDSNLTT